MSKLKMKIARLRLLLVSAAVLVNVAAMPSERKPRVDNPFGEAFNLLRKMMENDVFGLGSAPLVNGSVHHVETRRVEVLPGGGHKVVTHVQKRSFDNSLHDFKDEEKHTEIIKHANHTIKLIVRDGENMTQHKETQVGCVENGDCELSAYCDKLSYQCKPCHTKRQSCSTNEECCPGYRCDLKEKLCLKSKGREGEKCESKEDCSAEFCCALNDDGDGVCQPYLKEGEDCGKDPFLSFLSQGSLTMEEVYSGLPSRCSCKPGLRCTKQRGFLLMLAEVCAKPSNEIFHKRLRSRTRLRNHHTSTVINPLLALLKAPVRRWSETKDDDDDHRSKRQVSSMYEPRYFHDSEEEEPESEYGEVDSSWRHKRRLPIDMVNPFIVPSEDMPLIEESDADDLGRGHERDYNGQKRAFIEDFTDFQHHPKLARYDEDLDAVFENIMKGIIRAMKYVF